MSIIYEDSEIQIVETVTPNGKTTQLIPKAGSRTANQDAIQAKAKQAITGNQAYLGHAAIPAGAALTTTQLTTAVRLLVAQVDSLTRQNNALIRLALGLLDDASDS